MLMTVLRRTSSVCLSMTLEVLSCTNSTPAYWVDVAHLSNGVGSQLVGVVIAGYGAGGRPVGEHSHQPEP
jgi:hypothetical protein